MIFRIATVRMAMGIDMIKHRAFRRSANFFPKATISAGNCTRPTVTHVIMMAVTANKLTPWFNKSPPMT